MIFISWFFPILGGCLTSFKALADPDEREYKNTMVELVTGSVVLISIIAIYLLYIKILLTYWGLKRKLSLMKKNKMDEEKGQIRKLGIVMKSEKIVRFLKNSKYVIFVLSTFTICWIPWNIRTLYGFFTHQFGSFENVKELNCCGFTSGNNQSTSAVENSLGKVTFSASKSEMFELFSKN